MSKSNSTPLRLFTVKPQQSRKKLVVFLITSTKMIWNGENFLLKKIK